MIRLVRAELLKMLTTRLWWGLLIGVVAQLGRDLRADRLGTGQTCRGSLVRVSMTRRSFAGLHRRAEHRT